LEQHNKAMKEIPAFPEAKKEDGKPSPEDTDLSKRAQRWRTYYQTLAGLTEQQTAFEEQQLERGLKDQDVDLMDFYDKLLAHAEENHKSRMDILNNERKIRMGIEDETERAISIFELEKQVEIENLKYAKERWQIEQRISDQAIKQLETADKNKWIIEQVQPLERTVELNKQNLENKEKEIDAINEQMQKYQEMVEATKGRFTGAVEVSRNLQVAVSANENKTQLDVLKDQLKVAETSKKSLAELLKTAEEQLSIIEKLTPTVAAGA